MVSSPVWLDRAFDHKLGYLFGLQSQKFAEYIVAVLSEERGRPAQFPGGTGQVHGFSLEFGLSELGVLDFGQEVPVLQLRIFVNFDLW